MVQHCGEREHGPVRTSSVCLTAARRDALRPAAPVHGLTAGDVQEGAVDGGHPQVRGARVEHHGEGLGRRSQADLTIILGLFNNNKNTVFSGLYFTLFMCDLYRYFKIR